MNTVFKALSDPTRRKILSLLRTKGDMTAGDIAEQFDISKPSISHHLDLLKQAELVENYRRGQFIFYSLNMTVVDDLMEWVVNLKNK